MPSLTAFTALAALLALGAGAVLTAPRAALAQDEPAAEATGEATEATAAADAAADVAAEPGAIPDMVLGDPDAPVTVIEYASFTCPHCAAFHAEQFPQLKRDYIDTGRVRFVYREVYFDRFGLWASMIARCGGDMRFFGVADLLYEGQREWIGEGEPAAIAENLRRIGRTAGLDDAALDACLKDEAQAEALVAWFEENAEADAIRATPTLIIDGEQHQNMSYEELQGVLDEALAG